MASGVYARTEKHILANYLNAQKWKGHHHTERVKEVIRKRFKGIPKTEEHRQKMKRILKGRHLSSNTEFKKGGIPSFKNRHHSEKSKIKMSEIKKNKYIGINNPFYGKHHTKETIEKIRTKNKGRRSIKTQGKNHWNWQGGLTPLRELIRATLEYKQWRKAIFERDNWICQACDAKSGEGKTIYFEAHHKKSFIIIFQEFLQEYNQFSPVEDKETLVRLAVTYKPFWNLDDGETLCLNCHNLTKQGRGIYA